MMNNGFKKSDVASLAVFLFGAMIFICGLFAPAIFPQIPRITALTISLCGIAVEVLGSTFIRWYLDKKVIA